MLLGGLFAVNSGHTERESADGVCEDTDENGFMGSISNGLQRTYKTMLRESSEL
jgi:sugar lactone lactonase YvrE